MKSILTLSALFISVLAFGQEKQTPEPKAQGQAVEQSQSSGAPQGEVINARSSIMEARFDLFIANRVDPPLDRTGLALKDKEGLCKIHHKPLRKATIPMLYGLSPGPTYSIETEKKLFPNALTDIDAGCIVMRLKEATVLQCQKCIKAKTEWLNSQK